MPTIKKIWRDNTMPPTNYIWMEINLKGELIGVYEWYNCKWTPISICPDGCDTYTNQTIEAISDSDLASILVAPSSQQNSW